MGWGLPVFDFPLGGRGIKWLLRDEFTTDEAAPLTSPRACEPGPGTLESVNAGLSISAGALVKPSSTSATQFTSGPFNFFAGRALFYKFRVVNAYAYLGWAINALGSDGIGFVPSTGGYVSLFSSRTSRRAYVRLTAHNLIFEDDRLVWVDIPNGMTGAATITSRNISNDVWELDYIFVRDLPAPFNTDYGIATLHETTAVSGTAYTGVADAIIDLTVTAPNPLANTCELRYRVLDDQNYWTAYFDSAGAFKLDSVSGGTATNRISVAGVIAAGQTRIIRVICRGTKHACYTLAGATWTRQGSEIDISHQDTQTTIKPVAGTGWVLGQLDCWPRQSPYYAELDRV